MPTATLPHKPDLTVDQMFAALQTKFGEKYEVYKTALAGADVIIKKSGSTGVSIRLLQKKDKTLIRYGGMSPSAFVRMLAMGIIPWVILAMTAWKPITKEVGEFIENAPEFT